MTKPTRKTSAVEKSPKQPRDPHRTRKLHAVEEMEDLGEYVSNRQVDPWRGQFMQLGWNYCI